MRRGCRVSGVLQRARREVCCCGRLWRRWGGGEVEKGTEAGAGEVVRGAAAGCQVDGSARAEGVLLGHALEHARRRERCEAPCWSDPKPWVDPTTPRPPQLDQRLAYWPKLLA